VDTHLHDPVFNRSLMHPLETPQVNRTVCWQLGLPLHAARSPVKRLHTGIYKEQNRYVVTNFSAGLHYYHQSHGLNSVRRRASECVELYLRFMYGAVSVSMNVLLQNKNTITWINTAGLRMSNEWKTSLPT